MAGIMESVEASVSKRRLRMFGMISHILPDLLYVYIWCSDSSLSEEGSAALMTC